MGIGSLEKTNVLMKLREYQSPRWEQVAYSQSGSLSEACINPLDGNRQMLQIRKLNLYSLKSINPLDGNRQTQLHMTPFTGLICINPLDGNRQKDPMLEAIKRLYQSPRWEKVGIHTISGLMQQTKVSIPYIGKRQVNLEEVSLGVVYQSPRWGQAILFYLQSF